MAESEKGKTRFCSLCGASGVITPAERYRSLQLRYCTFHYWLVHGRVGPEEYSLEDYVSASKNFAFVTSLPSTEDCERMQKEYDRGRHDSKRVVELRT